MPIQAVIFDLDGTLIDSAPGILASFAAALAEQGVTPLRPIDESIIGPPLAEAIALLTGIEEATLIEAIATRFKRHYDEHALLATPAYPEVDALLRELADAGLALHVATNKRLAPASRIIERLGWRDRFSSVYALDMVAPRLPHKGALLARQLTELGLDGTGAVYVGDKHEDGVAAAANGLPFLYAAWGYGGLARAGAPGGWRWLDSPLDLPRALSHR